MDLSSSATRPLAQSGMSLKANSLRISEAVWIKLGKNPLIPAEDYVLLFYSQTPKLYKGIRHP